VIPHCIFTGPECASVGLTEQEARAAYDDGIMTGRFPFMGNGKALCEGQPQGFLKIIAKSADEEVLGVHILGAHASELISEASVAIQSRATLSDISRLIHPHPTLSEILMEAASDAKAEAIHLPPKLTT
jgi:dihydrolipoamide dehydrogenase